MWVVTIAAAFATLAVIALAPWNDLVTSAAFVDSPDLIVFTRLQPLHPADIATLFALALLAAFVLLVGRRFAILLPAAIAAVLVFASVPAAHDLAGAADAREAALAGPTPSWIDAAARGRPATYVYGGEATWTAVWLERFWNHDVRHVVTLGPKLVPGPLRQARIDVVPASGALPTSDRLVVAPDRLTLRGEPVAHLAQQGIEVSGLTLWRLDGRPRLSTATEGVQPNGDMTRPATVAVYGCTGGSLELTLLPKATSRLRVLLDGRVVYERTIAGHPSWSVAIPVPPGPRPRICRFTIVPQLLLGSTRIVFDRG